MAARNWLLSSGFNDGMVQNVNLTRYHSVLGMLQAGQTTEANCQILIRDTLSISNLWVRVIANTITADSVFTLRIGAASKTVTVTFGSGVTGTQQDTTHSEALATGDLIDTMLVTGATGTSLTTSIIEYQLQHASADVPIYGSYGSAAVAYSLTAWLSPVGKLEHTITAESIASYKVRVAGTLSNMRVYVNYNSNTKDGTLTSRIDSGTGNQTVTIDGSATGSFEDATHTDAISAAQTIGMQFVSGSKSGTNTTFTVAQYKYAAVGQIIGVGNAAPSAGYAFDTTNYFPMGTDDHGGTTQLSSQGLAIFASTVKNLLINCTTYTLDVAATIALQVNGDNSILTVSVAGTGYTEDTTHSVNLAATDLINFVIDTYAASSGYLSFSIIGMELQQLAAPPPSGQPYSSRVQGVQGMRSWGGF